MCARWNTHAAERLRLQKHATWWKINAPLSAPAKRHNLRAQPLSRLPEPLAGVANLALSVRGRNYPARGAAKITRGDRADQRLDMPINARLVDLHGCRPLGALEPIIFL